MPRHRNLRAGREQRDEYDRIKENREDVTRSEAQRIAAGVMDRKRAQSEAAGAASGRSKTGKNRTASSRSGARGRDSRTVRSTKRHS